MLNPVLSRRTLLTATSATMLTTQLSPAAAGPILTTQRTTPAGFAHPGLLHTADDLARMRTAVATQQAPQYDGFRALAAHPRSSYDYVVRNTGHITSWGRGPANFMAEAVSDSCAAYQNALMWCATGDTRHADKARDILNAWSGSLEAITGADGQLGSGLQGFKFANAAELLRHTGYSGWAQADIERCQESFRTVWYRSFAGYALFANGNWDVAALQAIIAIAVFCDDRVMFEDAVRYAVAGAGNGRIEHIVVEATGQGQESGRSQAYAQLALGLLSNAAAVAWNQGVDLFGHSDDDRLLKGFEYTARYNLGDNGVPFTADLDRTGKYLKTSIATGNRGQFQPIHELAYGHYVSRRGLPAPYLEQVIFRNGTRFVEGTNDDHAGWGTLTHAQSRVRPSTPTSPPGTPSGLTAHAGPTGVTLTWARSVDPRTCSNAAGYTVKRAVDNGTFATIATGVTSTAYTDSTATKPGRTYHYTITASNPEGESADSLPIAAHRMPWTSIDIGAIQGATNFDGQTVSIEAGGTDIAGTEDGLRFTYLRMMGNGTITARVVHPVSSQYAQVGVMMRQSLTPDSAHASMLIKGLPLHTWSGVWTVRPTQGAATSGTGSTKIPPTQQQAITTNAGFPISNLGSLPESATPLPPPYVEAASDGYRLRKPYWVRLTRQGNTFTGHISPDGTNWTKVGSAKLQLEHHLYVGLAACSTLDIETTTAAFDNVTAPGWSVPRPPAPLGELTARPDVSAVELTWTDLDHSGTYTVHRSTTPSGPYKVIATDISGIGVDARYRDATGVPGTTYHYKVAKTNRAGTGPGTIPASAVMPIPPAPTVTSPTIAFANVGMPFQYRINTTNDATSYAAPGLPRGLTLDAGIISGNPSEQGEFAIDLQATNATATATARLILAVAAPPPTPWSYRDIGDYVLDERALATYSSVAIRTPGITSYDAGTFTVHGAGSDLNVINQGMAAHYASTEVTADSTITARIVRTESGRAGLIMAKSLSPFDQLAGVIVTGDKIQFVRRLRVATTLVTTEITSAATWLRLTRAGESFQAETSPDGRIWSQLAPPTAIPAFGDAPYHAGLAVVSRNPFVLNTTVFDHVSIS